MDEACGIYGRGDKFMQEFGVWHGNLKEGYHLEDLVVGGRI